MNNQHTNTEQPYGRDLRAEVGKYLKGTFTDRLGLEILECGNGYCKAVLPVKEEFYNPIGVLHGGLLYTIADTTGGVAAIQPNDGEAVATISGSMDFMRPAQNAERLYVEGKVAKDGKRIVFSDVYVSSETGVLFNKASFTYARISLPGRSHPRDQKENGEKRAAGEGNEIYEADCD